MAKVADVDAGWFSDDSVTRRVWSHPGVRLYGSFREALMAAVLTDSAHGIETNSRYRSDPLGRAKRTMDFSAAVIYGTSEEAERASKIVRAVHNRVRGHDPVGRRDYSLATPVDGPGRELDRFLLIAGHVIIMESFMVCYDAFVEKLSREEQDQYLREVEVVAIGLGLQPGDVPTSVASRDAFYAELAPHLAMTPHGMMLWSALTDATVLNRNLWPAKPAHSLFVAQNLATIPDCFRNVMPAPLPRRMDPIVLRSGAATADVIARKPVRTAIDRAIVTESAQRLFAKGERAQRNLALTSMTRHDPRGGSDKHPALAG